MPQSLSRNLIYLIYSTKNREPCLSDELRPKLYAYKAGILKTWESPAIAIGGVSDHMHVLCALSKNLSLAKVVEEIKKGTSKWLKTQGVHSFGWQAGYGAFSVNESNLSQVANLHRAPGIASSKSCRSKMSFERS